MAERNIKARILRRRNSYIVYLKSGTAISAFLAFVGAHGIRAWRRARNDINRKVNAELANQAKSAEAAIDPDRQHPESSPESGKVADSLPPRAPGVRASSPSLSRCQLERARRAGEPAPFEVGGVSSRSSSRGYGPQFIALFRAAFVFGSTRRRLGAAGLFATPPRFFLWLGSPTFKPFVLEILSRCLHLMVESCRFYPLIMQGVTAMAETKSVKPAGGEQKHRHSRPAWASFSLQRAVPSAWAMFGASRTSRANAAAAHSCCCTLSFWSFWACPSWSWSSPSDVQARKAVHRPSISLSRSVGSTGFAGGDTSAA